MRLPHLALLLLAIAATLLAGCGDGTDDSSTGPSVLATGPRSSTSTPAPAAPTPATSGASSSAASAAPDDAPAACRAYSAMVAAIRDAALQSSDPEEIAAAIAPVMKRFAAEVADLPRPPGMSPATWAGVVALAAQIRGLPDHPTRADIDAVKRRLSPGQQRAVEAAAAWFKSSCGL